MQRLLDSLKALASHITDQAWLKKNWQQYASWAFIAVITLVLQHYGCAPNDPLPPIPEPIFEPGNMGWVKDEAATKAVQSQLEFKVFGDTPAGMADDALPKFVYLWQNYQKLFGAPPPSKNQSNIGSCVSFGTNNGVARTLATQIVIQGGQKDEFKDIAEEVTYGGSRVQVGGGRIRGDGSNGSWGAQFVQKWGVVERKKYPTVDLSSYSVSLCRQYGDRGVPIDLQAVAREHPVKDITFCKSWADVKRALASGYGVSISTDQGFDGNRDVNGVKKPRGSWPHCMAIDGYHTEGAKEYGHYENSWGPKPNEGPVGWGNPPDSGFWVESGVIDRLCKIQGNEVIAFSAVKGWPSRKLDWFVQVAPRPDPGWKFANKEVLYAMSP